MTTNRLCIADLGLYGGFVVITGGTSTLRVPYFGLKGDYGKLDPVQTITMGAFKPGETCHRPLIQSF